MKTRQNLHMHSTYDDGQDSCADMLEACQRAGLTSGGISLHSPLPFKTDWTPDLSAIPGYQRELDALKRRFGTSFRVLSGIEWDVQSDPSMLNGFEYVIGSVHHFPVAEIPPSVDNTPEELANTVQTCFGGDADAAAECYFRELLKVAEEPKTAICGHFDLLLKFQEHQPLFDPQSPRYLRAASQALHALIDAGKVFEVNTGAVYRGWRSEPYPQRTWLTLLAQRGAQVMLSSDAHAAAHVVASFKETEALLRACGFDHVVELGPNGAFIPVSLID